MDGDKKSSMTHRVGSHRRADGAEFCVGDVVYVREWEDMAEEYGVTPLGTKIKTKYYFFTKGMNVFCGQQATITSIRNTVICLDFNDKDLNKEARRHGWKFTCDMLYHQETSPYTHSYEEIKVTLDDLLLEDASW